MRRVLSFLQTLDVNLAAPVKNILMGLREDLVTSVDARMSLLNLSKEANGPHKNAILAVESLLPGIKDLDIGSRSEDDLSASFIHPVIQALFAIDDTERAAYCSNCLLNDNVGMDKRPDYVVDLYKNYQYAFTTCYGEIKPKNAPSRYPKNHGLLPTSNFAKEGMDKQTLNGILCFQAIGSEITFYIMNRPCPTLDTNVCRSVIDFVTSYKERYCILDDLLSIVKLHLDIDKTAHNVPPSSPSLSFDLIQGNKKNLPPKRSLSLDPLTPPSKRQA